MEDIYVFLYNFFCMLVLVFGIDFKLLKFLGDVDVVGGSDMVEMDNGYFVIFDGYVGMFVVDWCGKKFYFIFEDIIKKNLNLLIFELFD